MKSAKLDVLVAFFAYGGNGGTASQLPAIGQWWAKTYHQMANDERVGRIACQTFADTPITMTRNQAVEVAKAGGFDVLIMIDSDNEIDLYGSDWWSSSYGFLYGRALRSLPTVVFAPYCGPPPHPTRGGEENVYVFKWTNMESDSVHPGYKLTAYDRDEAAGMTGIQAVGAGPTGVIMYSVTSFELQQPPHFYYEWTNATQSAKASTEDVTNTRDISMMGWEKYKEDVVFCNWDCWAGHHKPKCVGKPTVLRAGQVSRSFAQAVLAHTPEKIVDVDFTAPCDSSHTDDSDNGQDGEEKIRTVAKEVRRVKQIAKGQNGQRVLTMGDPCPDEKLQVLSGFVGTLRSERALRLLQVDCCWVGEETLALLHGAPKGSTIYCKDDWSAAAKYGLTADEVRERWKKNVGKKLDKQVKLLDFIPDDPQGLDVIAVRIADEYSVEGYSKIIDGYMRHLAPHGLLIGFGLGVVAEAALQNIPYRTMPQLDLWLMQKAEYERSGSPESVPTDGQ